MKIKMLNARPNRMKIIPPVFSHFHAMISKPSITIEGIRCINNATVFCQIVFPAEKESKANRLIKRIDRITKILGVQ
jgi:hypothetical protein